MKAAKMTPQEQMSSMKWRQFLEEFNSVWSHRGVDVSNASGPAELRNRLRLATLSVRRAEREVHNSLREFKERTILAA